MTILTTIVYAAHSHHTLTMNKSKVEKHLFNHIIDYDKGIEVSNTFIYKTDLYNSFDLWFSLSYNTYTPNIETINVHDDTNNHLTRIFYEGDIIYDK